MGAPLSGSGSRAPHEAASSTASSPKASIPSAVEGVIDDIHAFPSRFSGDVLSSIAVSLRRMVEMMEEDRKPRIELAPEGWVSDTEHRRILRDGLERDGQTWLRIADSLEALAKARGEHD